MEFTNNSLLNEFNIKLLLQDNIFIYLYINLACLSVCLFVSNKRQNG